jgi:hypothetical protein
MMARGTEDQMEQAKKILVGKEYDPRVPHCNGEKPPWPTKQQILDCGKLG